MKIFDISTPKESQTKAIKIYYDYEKVHRFCMEFIHNLIKSENYYLNSKH